jgi:hypothetical protein
VQRKKAMTGLTRQAIKGNKGIAVRPTFQPEDKFVTIGSIRFLTPIKPRSHSSCTFPRIRLDAQKGTAHWAGVESDSHNDTGMHLAHNAREILLTSYAMGAATDGKQTRELYTG